MERRLAKVKHCQVTSSPLVSTLLSVFLFLQCWLCSPVIWQSIAWILLKCTVAHCLKIACLQFPDHIFCQIVFPEIKVAIDCDYPVIKMNRPDSLSALKVHHVFCTLLTLTQRLHSPLILLSLLASCNLTQPRAAAASWKTATKSCPMYCQTVLDLSFGNRKGLSHADRLFS